MKPVAQKGKGIAGIVLGVVAILIAIVVGIGSLASVASDVAPDGAGAPGAAAITHSGPSLIEITTDAPWSIGPVLIATDRAPLVNATH